MCYTRVVHYYPMVFNLHIDHDTVPSLVLDADPDIIMHGSAVYLLMSISYQMLMSVSTKRSNLYD